MCPPRATSGLVDDRRGPISTSVIEPDVAQHVSTDGAPGSYPGRFAFRPRRRRSASEIDTGFLHTRRCIGEQYLSMTPVEEPQPRLITPPITSETEPVPDPPSAVLLIVTSVTMYGATVLGLPAATISKGHFVSSRHSARPTPGQSARRIARSSRRTHPAVRQSVVLRNPDLNHDNEKNTGDWFPCPTAVWTASQVWRRRIAGER